MRVYRNPGCYQASRAEQSVRRGAIRALEETVLRTTLYFVSHGKPSSSRRSRSPQPPRQSTELAGPHQSAPAHDPQQYGPHQHRRTPLVDGYLPGGRRCNVLLDVYVPSPLLHYLASVYAMIFIGASVLAVFGYLMLRLRPPTVVQGGSVEEDAVPWNRKTYRRPGDGELIRR
jgi:hypothetical protein